MGRAQSAIEFLSTYAIALLIISAVIILIAFFVNIPPKFVQSSCNLYGLLSCTSVIYSVSNAPGTSQLIMVATDAQPGVIAVNSFNAVVAGTPSKLGYCLPSIISTGQTVYCVALFNSAPKPDVLRSGSLLLRANYCSYGAQNLTAGNCTSGSTYTQYGYFTATTSAATANVGNVAYQPITISNNQGAATPSGFQQMISVNPLSFSSNERSDLGNIRFYYNGAELHSWCEANCTSTTAKNAIFWVRLPISLAPSSAAPRNAITINMYFMPLFVEYDGVYAGEAPQLSSGYAAFDNGASVFNFYDDFAGNTLNSQWTVNNVGYTVNNMFIATNVIPSAGTSNAFIISKAIAITPGNNIIDFYGINFQTDTQFTLVGALDGRETSDTSGSGLGSLVVAGWFTAGQTTGLQRNSIGLTTGAAMQTAAANAVWTIQPVNVIAANFLINYAGTQTVSASADKYPLYEGLIATRAGGVPYTFSKPVRIVWYRVRLAPPGGVSPSVIFGVPKGGVGGGALPLSASLTPPDGAIDKGQSFSLITVSSGGTTPYSYKWYTAPAPGTCSTGDTLIGGATSSSYTASPATNTLYCSIVTDSSSNTASTSTSNVIVNMPMNTPSMNAIPTQMNIGSSTTLTTTWTGGTSPFTVNWYANSAPNCGSGTGNSLLANTASTTGSASFSLTPSTTLYYCATVTDNALETVNSGSVQVRVIVPFGIPTLTASSNTLDAGQTETFTAAWSGGLAPYTVTFYNVTGRKVQNSLVTGTTSVTNSFIAGATGIFQYNVIVTDSSPNSLTSSIATITVNPALGTMPVLTVSNSFFDLGQTETFTLSWTGGTPPYTVNYINNTRSYPTQPPWTSDQFTGVMTTTNSLTLVSNYIRGTGPTTANPPTNLWRATIIDSANALNIVNTPVITVNVFYAPAVGMTCSASLDGGCSSAQFPTQPDAIEATIRSGDSPFTYQWYRTPITYPNWNSCPATVSSYRAITGQSGTAVSQQQVTYAATYNASQDGGYRCFLVIFTDSASTPDNAYGVIAELYVS